MLRTPSRPLPATVGWVEVKGARTGGDERRSRRSHGGEHEVARCGGPARWRAGGPGAHPQRGPRRSRGRGQDDPGRGPAPGHRRDDPPGADRGRHDGLRPRGGRAAAGPLGVAGRGERRPRGGEGQLHRHPGAPRLRGRGAGGAEGGGCRPLRRLGRGRRRRHDPHALGRVRHGRHASSRRGHPPRPAARRLRRGPGDLPARVRRRRAAALPPAARRRRDAGRAHRPAVAEGVRLLRRHPGGARGRRRAPRAHRGCAVRTDRGDHPGVRGRRPARPLARRRGRRLRHARRGPREGGGARGVPPRAARERGHGPRDGGAARGRRPGLPLAPGAPGAHRLHPRRRCARTHHVRRRRAAGGRGRQNDHRPVRRPDQPGADLLGHPRPRRHRARLGALRPVRGRGARPSRPRRRRAGGRGLGRSSAPRSPRSTRAWRATWSPSPG